MAAEPDRRLGEITRDNFIAIMARAIWLESAIFPTKALYWDTPGKMLSVDQEPYLNKARAALEALEAAGFVITPAGRAALARSEGK